MKKTNIGLALICTSLILAGCNSSNSSNQSACHIPSGAPMAIVNLKDPGFEGSDLGFIDLTADNLQIRGENCSLKSNQSDLGLISYNKHFYRLGKYDIDTLSKYSIEAPSDQIYSYATTDLADNPTNNPDDLIFASETKAYLLQRSSNELAVINPSAASADNGFKLATIDLGSLDDSDDIPEMVSGVIVDGKLYVILQNLTGHRPVNVSKIAVIDTETDLLLKSISLKTRNPLSIAHADGLGLIVASAGYSQCSFSCTEQERADNVKTSGVEVVNLSDDSTEVFLEGTSAYGINHLAIVDKDKAYISLYKGWGNEEVRAFDLNTKTLDLNTLDNLSGFGIGGLAVNDGKLWVSINNAGTPSINLYNTTDDSFELSLETQGYNPKEVVFIKE